MLSTSAGNAEIVRNLGISPKTLRNHISNTYHKLGIFDRAQAVLIAVPEGKGRSQPLATGNSVLPSARSCDGRHTGERRPSEWGLRGEPSPPAQIPAFRNGWDAGHSQ